MNPETSKEPAKRRRRPALERRREAHEVAELLVAGFEVKTVAKRLFGSTGLDSIQRVKRAIRYAHDQGIVKLVAPTYSDLSADLRRRYHAIEFTVVHELREAVANEPFVNSPICQTAARLIAGEIRRLDEKLSADERRRSIVVSNAGGLTLYRTIRHLQAEATPVNRPPLFISMNSAQSPTKYNLSANFLACQLAGIYSGDHMAVLGSVEPAAGYEKAISSPDLVLCGAGTKSGFFRQHLKLEDRQLPAEMIGDIALHPIDSEGKLVRSEAIAKGMEAKNLSRYPNYDDLLSWAGKGKIITILEEYPEAETSTDEVDKVRLARALFERGLTSKCVLGESLARRCLQRD